MGPTKKAKLEVPNFMGVPQINIEAWLDQLPDEQLRKLRESLEPSKSTGITDWVVN